MNVKITKGIKITVSTKYRDDLTRLDIGLYFFNYSIKIENHNTRKVQLLSRHWKIVDSLSATRIIEGEGVIGEKPVLNTGETFTYTSGCDLNSPLGYMEGYFLFKTVDDSDEEILKVEVPKFLLEYNGKLN